MLEISQLSEVDLKNTYIQGGPKTWKSGKTWKSLEFDNLGKKKLEKPGI